MYYIFKFLNAAYFISTRILLLFLERKTSKQKLSNKCMSKIKTRPLSRCTRMTVPVKTNHMIDVLNTILLQLDLKVMNSDLLNMRQITLPI